MSLPPPDNNIRWKDYEISTPTFELTPVEKPDMSPFLIHMTGKKEIISILKGNEADKQNNNHGVLKVNLPEHNRRAYTQKMVCFTESPTFALDFFRYRKFTRWNSDQRYGIGFDKSAMISRNVRPANYIEDDITTIIISVYNKIKNQKNTLDSVEYDDFRKEILDMFEYLYKFNFPLCDTKEKQGFMWEREWRFAGETDFEFNYEDIKIICCPNEEKSEIIDILGDFQNKIEFVESWHEYSVVTKFLKEQDDIREAQDGNRNLQTIQKINLIKDEIKKIKLEKNMLESFNQNLESLIKEKEQAQEAINKANEKLEKLQNDLSKLEPKESDQKQVKNAPRKIDMSSFPLPRAPKSSQEL